MFGFRDVSLLRSRPFVYVLDSETLQKRKNNDDETDRTSDYSRVFQLISLVFGFQSMRWAVSKYPWAEKPETVSWKELSSHLRSDENAQNMLRTLGQNHYLLVLIFLSPPFALWVVWCNIVMRLCKYGRGIRGMVVSIMMFNDFTGFQTHHENALWIIIKWHFNYKLYTAPPTSEQTANL